MRKSLIEERCLPMEEVAAGGDTDSDCGACESGTGGDVGGTFVDVAATGGLIRCRLLQVATSVAAEVWSLLQAWPLSTSCRLSGGLIGSDSGRSCRGNAARGGLSNM